MRERCADAICGEEDAATATERLIMPRISNCCKIETGNVIGKPTLVRRDMATSVTPGGASDGKLRGTANRQR